MTAGSGERLAWLDAVRGAAVLGIIPLNARWLLHPRAHYTDPAAAGEPGAIGWTWWAATTITLDETTLWVLSAAFGAALAATRDTTQEAGWTARHRARLATLGALGLAQSLLVWPGDILLPYAITALLLSGAVADRQCKPRTLAIGAAVMPLVAAAAGITMSDPDSAHAGAGAAYAEWESGAYAGDFRAAVGARWLQLQDQIGQTYPYRVLWQTAAAMLAGVWWHRAGREHATRAGCGALAAGGLALTTGAVAVVTASGYEPHAITTARSILYAGGALLAATTLRWASSAPQATWETRTGSALRAIGRRSLSVYLGANITLAAIAQGWGMGLHGRLNEEATIGVVVTTTAAAAALAGRGNPNTATGPAERAWRLATRLLAGSRAHRRAKPKQRDQQPID